MAYDNIFKLFPNERYMDITLYQYGMEQCSASYSYGPATRADIPAEEKYKKFAELGFSAVQLHDDDAVPNIND